MISLEIEIVKWLQQNRFISLDPYWIFISEYTTVFNLLIVALSVFLYTKKKNDINLYGFSGLYLGLFIAQALLSWAIKNLVNRIRPFQFDGTIEKLSSGGSPSFPSGHTMETFAIIVFFWLIFPKQPFKWILVIWALAVSYSRMVLGVHYLSDVIGGAILGSIMATLFYLFYKKLYAKKALQSGFSL